MPLAPPYITFKNPYGGLGLKTTSAESARGRIDRLLAACAVDATLATVGLAVNEPTSDAFVDALAGPNGAPARRDPKVPLLELARAHGHTLGEAAAEAWRRFGTPDDAAGHRGGRYPGVEWIWRVENDPAVAPARLADWFPFLCAHQHLMRDDYAPSVDLQATWTLRLRSTAGAVANPVFPLSRVHAYLRGRHACAFFDLVFPYSTVDAAFLADYHTVCEAMALRLPPKNFRLSAPTRRGDDRRLVRLPAFD